MRIDLTFNNAMLRQLESHTTCGIGGKTLVFSLIISFATSMLVQSLQRFHTTKCHIRAESTTFHVNYDFMELDLALCVEWLPMLMSMETANV